MNNLTTTALLALISMLPVTVSAAESITIISNARVWTGTPDQPWASTIVVQGNRITAVGDAQLATTYPQTHKLNAQTIDAEGQLVLPGFIDNHTHFMDGSASLVSIQTQYAKTIRQFKAVVKRFSKTAPDNEWILGGLWDHEAWGGELPQRRWIDRYTTSKPLFLLRTDGHMALANTAALELAGIDNNTADPAGGVIVRDSRGNPTGVLKDNAMRLVTRVIPAMNEDQAARMFDAGVAEALANGVTQVHNMSNWDNIAIFEKAQAEGRLKIRTYYFPHISFRQQLAERIKTQGRGDGLLRVGGVKELVDGSLGSTTAWFYDPYTDEPDTSGFPLMTMDALEISLREAHALGLQLAIHGIGDQANDKILGLFESLFDGEDLKKQRPRIEHAQHLTAAAIKKFGQLGVIPSMQPYHAIDDGRWAEQRIGARRLNGTYAFKSLLDAGAPLTFGSDWSVAPLRPLLGIHAAVTRATLDGKNPAGWVAAEKITVEQAVRAYTTNNAWAGFQEDDLGTIEAGKLADLVMLNANIFDIPAEQLTSTRVVLTMIDGKIMFRAKDSKQ